MPQKILITGGTGYIGAHTTLKLLEEDFDVVVLDNLSNSSSSVLHKIETLCGRTPTFILGDVRDAQLLKSIFAEHSINAVVHLAGVKAIGESVRQPLTYYDNNVAGSITLCKAMANAEVHRLIFSSSATVYGATVKLPIKEDAPTNSPTNPYGRSKAMVEDVLNDLAASDSCWRIAILRYFNPAGAHESGLLGEAPSVCPNNLVPIISKVALGELEHVSIFGNDYPTHDGTGVRDYVHVADLASAHKKALQALDSRSGVNIWNLGTGTSHSVLDVIRAFEQVSGRQIHYQFAERRSGDVAECWTDPSKAWAELGWQAESNLQEIVRSAWHWQQLTP
jgi:UDP-glucose 4-epimerase